MANYFNIDNKKKNWQLVINDENIKMKFPWFDLKLKKFKSYEDEEIVNYFVNSIGSIAKNIEDYNARFDDLLENCIKMINIINNRNNNQLLFTKPSRKNKNIETNFLKDNKIFKLVYDCTNQNLNDYDEINNWLITNENYYQYFLDVSKKYFIDFSLQNNIKYNYENKSFIFIINNKSSITIENNNIVSLRTPYFFSNNLLLDSQLNIENIQNILEIMNKTNELCRNIDPIYFKKFTKNKVIDNLEDLETITTKFNNLCKFIPNYKDIYNRKYYVNNNCINYTLDLYYENDKYILLYITTNTPGKIILDNIYQLLKVLGNPLPLIL